MSHGSRGNLPDSYSVDNAPRLELIKRAPGPTDRLGVFASSFNPLTIAHIELTNRASAEFKLEECLAVVGERNADKTSYEASLEDRLAMMKIAFADNPQISIGVCSHAFYVDMIEAIDDAYPGRGDLHFIVGFDTFERVIDRDDRYTARYHRRFADRVEALNFLLDRSSLIVAGRAGEDRDSMDRLIAENSFLDAGRIHYLNFPSDLGEISASEVRRRRRAGISISELVPATVEQYLIDHDLYSAGT